MARGLGSLQYVMTLQGLRQVRGQQLGGVFDPIINNPLLFAIGLGLGVYLGARHRR